MKLTFENWLKGEIELVETYKNDVPKKEDSKHEKYQNSLFSFQQFSEQDQTKIKNAQQAYFNELSTKLYNEHLNEFNIRYNKAKTPIIVLEEELFRLNQLINGEWAIDTMNRYINKFLVTSFSITDFGSFSDYISKIKKREYEPYFGFMPSPNSKYYNINSSIIPEIYAEAFYKFHLALSKRHPNPDKISRMPQEYFIEPSDYDETIFANGWAYRAFDIMVQTVAVNSRTYNADYALIYHCLQFPDVGGILSHVDKNTFANYVNVRLGLDHAISVNQLKKSISLDKNRTIRYGLKYYLKRTGFEGDIEKLLRKVTL